MRASVVVVSGQEQTEESRKRWRAWGSGIHRTKQELYFSRGAMPQYGNAHVRYLTRMHAYIRIVLAPPRSVPVCRFSRTRTSVPARRQPGETNERRIRPLGHA